MTYIRSSSRSTLILVSPTRLWPSWTASSMISSNYYHRSLQLEARRLLQKVNDLFTRNSNIWPSWTASSMISSNALPRKPPSSPPTSKSQRSLHTKFKQLRQRYLRMHYHGSLQACHLLQKVNNLFTRNSNIWPSWTASSMISSNALPRKPPSSPPTPKSQRSLHTKFKHLTILNSFVNDIFERITTEASKLATYSKKSTISSHEIQTSDHPEQLRQWYLRMHYHRSLQARHLLQKVNDLFARNSNICVPHSPRWTFQARNLWGNQVGDTVLICWCQIDLEYWIRKVWDFISLVF